jgi:hypothetical protein
MNVCVVCVCVCVCVSARVGALQCEKQPTAMHVVWEMIVLNNERSSGKYNSAPAEKAMNARAN